mgnify:CR=1 FL=1
MSEEQNVSIAYASLRARCPRCGKGALYSSFLTIAETCLTCGLSFKEHEQGDGPAFFCICIIGSFTAMFAAIVEVMFEPPYWLHAAIWIPLIIVSSVLGIRAMKAALIALQYKFRNEDFTS